MCVFKKYSKNGQKIVKKYFFAHCDFGRYSKNTQKILWPMTLKRDLSKNTQKDSLTTMCPSQDSQTNTLGNPRRDHDTQKHTQKILEQDFSSSGHIVQSARGRIWARLLKGIGHHYDGLPFPSTPPNPTVIGTSGPGWSLAVYKSRYFTVVGDMWFKITS